MLSTLLSQARYDELVPWEAIEDRSRRYISLTGWTDLDEYLTEKIKLGGKMDMFVISEQDQETYIELWTEKDVFPLFLCG